MSLITILLGLGICGFLAWFFEAILKDIWADEDCESEVIYLRRQRRRVDSSVSLSEDSYVAVSAEEKVLTRHSDVA